MKRLQSFVIATILFLFVGLAMSASVPKAMDYNLMLINPKTGHVMINKSAEVRLELRQGSQSGTAVWSRNYSVKSDATGMVNITLNFSDNIDWDAAEYYLAMLVDNKEAGVAKLMSVPYAFVADRLSNVLTKEELIGTWREVDDYRSYLFTFNEDGTGYLSHEGGLTGPITWNIGPSRELHYRILGGTEYNEYYRNSTSPTIKISSTEFFGGGHHLVKQ